MGDSSVLFDGLDENPLPDAYEVSLKDTDKFDDTVKRISELPHVLHIRENRQLAKQLAGLRNTVSYVSAGMIALLLIVSLFIVSNTIRITMDSRRLEINIMKRNRSVRQICSDTARRVYCARRSLRRARQCGVDNKISQRKGVRDSR